MKLKGTDGSSRTRTARPMDFKVEVVRLVRNENLTPKEAFKQVCEERDLPLTKSMIEYPASIFDSYVKAISGALEKDDSETEKLVSDAGLDEDEPELVGESSDDTSDSDSVED